MTTEPTASEPAEQTALAAPMQAWLQHLQANRRYAGHTLDGYGRDLRRLAELAAYAKLPLERIANGHIRQFVARLHAQGLGPRSLARALAAWRERRAIGADRPRNWILPDAALRDIVLSVPRSMRQLGSLEELPEGICRRSGPEILALIDSLSLPAALPPLAQRRRPDPAELEAVKRLAQLTAQTGRELGIAPEVLATRREMERMVAGERNAAPLSGWRRAVIGERLLSAL